MPLCVREKGKVDQARKSLTWLRPNKDAVEGESISIQAAIEESKENVGKALFFEMFRNPVDRRLTILAVAAVNTQAASGAMYVHHILVSIHSEDCVMVVILDGLLTLPLVHSRFM